jgi:uncharacterized protein YgbK (DUF1537 family)
MIGAVADDVTGATDSAVAFRRAGLRAAVLFGVPDDDAPLRDADAVVVGLKTRTIPADDAVAQSLHAARWLLARGADRLYSKVCSTFDSRQEGNIGPVADALADLAGADLVVVTPASPEHGRTQYLGHLFVHGELLADSPMRHHPLTPMTDSRVVRLLQAQTPHPVGLVPHSVVRRGAAAIEAALAELRDLGARYAVADAIDDEDLAAVGRAAAALPLAVGAAGLAGGLGAALAEERESPPPEAVPSVGPAAVLAGSCSARTLEQVAVMRRTHDAYSLDPVASPDPARLADDALTWYDVRQRRDAPLFSTSAPPEELARVQAALGADRASAVLEEALGRIARGLAQRGVRRIVVAGGETSGAVVAALGVRGGLIGAEAAPGVPWIHPSQPEGLALLLKSGNFGGPTLLVDAVRCGAEAA